MNYQITPEGSLNLGGSKFFPWTNRHFWCRRGNCCEADNLRSSLGSNCCSFSSNSRCKRNRIGMLVLLTVCFNRIDIFNLQRVGLSWWWWWQRCYWSSPWHRWDRRLRVLLRFSKWPSPLAFWLVCLLSLHSRHKPYRLKWKNFNTKWTIFFFAVNREFRHTFAAFPSGSEELKTFFTALNHFPFLPILWVLLLRLQCLAASLQVQEQIKGVPECLH